MSDIVAFLNARLDEDEALAREASAFYDDDQINGVSWNGHEGEDLNGQMRYWIAPHLGVVNDIASGRHIGRHDPARVLREVKAKRYRLELYWAASENWRNGACVMGTTEEVARAAERRDVLRLAVQLDAMSYADHPDYNAAWTVET